MFAAGKHVNGSPFQKSTYRRQTFGLIIQMGSPVLWITISPAVVHSPIFLQIAGYDVNVSQIPSLGPSIKYVRFRGWMGGTTKSIFLCTGVGGWWQQ